MPKYQIVDLFAGICGVSYSFEETGHFEPALLIDNDENARNVVVLNYPTLQDRFREDFHL